MLKQDILNKLAEVVALVYQIVEDDSAAQIAALQAQVLDLQGQLAAKEAELVDVKAKLAEANALFKQGDALIDDPA